jgi:ribonucleoside-diphosphate reductase alpha chain
MVAAVQPFVSGGLSTTVNLPEHATVDDVESVFVDAWTSGLKSVTVYRQGSKLTKPLATGTADRSAAWRRSAPPRRPR